MLHLITRKPHQLTDAALRCGWVLRLNLVPPSTRHAQERREVARSEGKCIVCLKRDAIPGQAKCGVCSEDAGDWIAEARASARRKGRCIYCLKAPATRGLNPKGQPWSSCKACRVRAKAKRKDSNAA